MGENVTKEDWRWMGENGWKGVSCRNKIIF